MAQPSRQRQLAYFLCNNPDFLGKPSRIAQDIGCSPTQAKVATHQKHLGKEKKTIKLTSNDRFFLSSFLKEENGSGIHQAESLFRISARYAGNLRSKILVPPLKSEQVPKFALAARMCSKCKKEYLGRKETCPNQNCGALQYSFIDGKVARNFRQQFSPNSHTEIAKAKLISQNYPSDEIEDSIVAPFYQELARMIIDECKRAIERRKKTKEEKESQGFPPLIGNSSYNEQLVLQKQLIGGDSPRLAKGGPFPGRLAEAAREIKAQSEEWKQVCNKVGLVKSNTRGGSFRLR